MNDVITDEERHEAASEEPTTVGCPSLGLARLPGGFDGAESATVPEYEWMARIMTSDWFDPEQLAKAIEAEAAKRPIDYPTFYTPRWLAELAKRLSGKKDRLQPLDKRIAKTPQTIVFETIRPSGMRLSAEWEAESTCHGAQAYLYKEGKCVCRIEFLNEFQSRNVGRAITLMALKGLCSVVGRNAMKKANRKARALANGSASAGEEVAR